MQLDHLVATEDGQKRIDEIEVGDKVWAYNIFTGETELKEVLTVYVHDDETEILHLHTTAGDVDTTTNHPFYVLGRGWVAAGDLNEGDEVYLIDGSTAYVTGAELERFTEPVTVYNLEVADLHTYFVGEKSILVHNDYDTTVPEEVNAFGNASGPRDPRADIDFGVNSTSDTVGIGGDLRHGASTYTTDYLDDCGLNGHYWKLPSGTKLPDGLDVIPGSTHKQGHRSIIPTKEMSLGDFIELFKKLPWEHGGKKK